MRSMHSTYYYLLLQEQETIGRQLEVDRNEKETARLVARHHEIGEILENAGFWRRKERIESVLFGLDFKKEDLENQHRPSLEAGRCDSRSQKSSSKTRISSPR